MGTNFYKIYYKHFWYKYVYRIIIFQSKLKTILGYDNYITIFKYNPLSKYNNHKEYKL